MRFVSGQGILELKETQRKTTSGKWEIIMCMYRIFLYERRAVSQQLLPNSLSLAVFNQLTHIGGKIMPFI